MNDWKETTLGGICDFANGKGIKNSFYTDEGAYSVWGANGRIAKTNKLLKDEPAVVIGRVGAYCGSVHLANEPSWVTDNAIIATAKPKNDLHFIYYLLKQLDLRRTAIGSAQPLMTQGGLKVIRVKVPNTIQEQKRIAGILGSLDDKIELNRCMNSTLESIGRALFKSWFVDFDPVKAKAAGGDAKLPAEIADLFPDSFEESESGPIPKGWKVGRLGDEFRITMGQSPPGKTYNENGDGVVFYQGRRDFGFRYPTPRVHCTEPKRFAEQDDTLVSVRAPVGDVNMASERCCIGRGVAMVRHNSSSRSFTYYSMHYQGDIFASFEAEGTVFGSINKKGFSNIRCVIPPKELVEQYEDKCYATDQMIEVNERQSQCLIKQRDTLLPKLLSGELCVPDANKLMGDVI